MTEYTEAVQKALTVTITGEKVGNKMTPPTNIVDFDRLETDVLFQKIKEKLPAVVTTPKILVKLEAVNYVKDTVMFANMSFEINDKVELISVPFNLTGEELSNRMTSDVLAQNLFKQSKEHFILLETLSNDLKDSLYENFSGLVFSKEGEEISEQVRATPATFDYTISFV